MAINKIIDGEFEVECDFCSWVEEIPAENFRETTKEMREIVWKIFKEGSDWFHKCPSCAEEAPAQSAIRDFG